MKFEEILNKDYKPWQFVIAAIVLIGIGSSVPQITADLISDFIDLKGENKDRLDEQKKYYGQKIDSIKNFYSLANEMAYGKEILAVYGESDLILDDLFADVDPLRVHLNIIQDSERMQRGDRMYISVYHESAKKEDRIFNNWIEPRLMPGGWARHFMKATPSDQVKTIPAPNRMYMRYVPNIAEDSTYLGSDLSLVLLNEVGAKSALTAWVYTDQGSNLIYYITITWAETDPMKNKPLLILKTVQAAFEIQHLFMHGVVPE